MAEIWKGAPVAAALNEITKEKCRQLMAKNVFPKLAILRVGDKDDDIAYENSAIRRCENLGIGIKKVLLHRTVSQHELLGAIEGLNEDSSVHGILMLRPFPCHLDETEACKALSPSKDVDGASLGSLAGVFSDTEIGFPPCTAQACEEILQYHNVNLAGKTVVVVGRSLVIGKPVAMMLLRENATVTICHTKTKNLDELCQRADIIVAAAGRRNVICANALSEQQIVIDVGIHVLDNGEMCGDVDRLAADKTVFALTPVPGGVGSVTTAVLASHIVKAAENLM